MKYTWKKLNDLKGFEAWAAVTALREAGLCEVDPKDVEDLEVDVRPVKTPGGYVVTVPEVWESETTRILCHMEVGVQVLTGATVFTRLISAADGRIVPPEE
jgi:hypothetical protein